MARHVGVSFDASSDAPSTMRAVVRAVLAGGSSELCADVEIAISELVSNVVEHAGSDGSLTVTTYGDGAVLVTVSDSVASWGGRRHATSPGGREPGRRDPGRRDLGGRGLGIVDAVADEWDVERSPRGKVVWAYFVGSAHPGLHQQRGW